MKRAYKCILVGLICGWLLAIILGRRVGPGCRTHIRIEQVKEFVSETTESAGIDEIENRIRNFNEVMSTWKNPYTLELKDEEKRYFVIASPKYKTMYNLKVWERIMFLNFSKFEYPTIKEEVSNQTSTEVGLRPIGAYTPGGTRNAE